MKRSAALAAALVAALLPASAAAQLFPTRSGETGILDVPDAEVSGVGGGQAGVEYRFDHREGYPDDLGPMPLYGVAGASRKLDVGLTMRQGGQPGDPRPARSLFGAALKLQLRAPDGFSPGLALSGIFDRFNERGVLGARLALSTGQGPFRVAAFGGGEAEVSGFKNGGLTAGIAATVALHPRFEIAAEALTGPRGQNVGLAMRVYQSPTVGISLGGNYFPDERSYSVGFALSVAPPRAPKRIVPPGAEARESAQVAVATGPKFLDDRPHFRLRMPVLGPDAVAAPRRLQYGPYVAKAVAATPARPVEPGAGGAKAAAPSLEDLADAQLRDQETLAATRERRVRATADELATREQAGAAAVAKLADAEKALAGREQQLDARQRLIVVRGAPTQQQRQLESLEAQLGSEMQKLSALDRSYLPALDAAQGRERDAAAREKAEHDEALRLATAASAATSRAAQLELRKQALGAKNRELAALEARLIAIGERLDSTERQLRLRQQRLDAWSRRLDARTERLDALEQANAPKPPAAAPAPRPTDAAAPSPRDKAAFVMVVKSPTAIMKEKGAATAAPATSSPLHAGAAVEKAVAAATVVAFPTPATQLTELDRETLVNMAKLAARDRCELLIWARAKDPSLMTEAQRRATELQTLVMSAAKLDPGQVVTRITMRPGAQGVDVVVSALRETARPAGAAAPAAAGPTLLSAESGKRQIREAVQAAQSSIETCIGEHLRKRRMQRAEGALKLTVSPQGRVAKIGTGGGELAGEELQACLQASSPQWQFPVADGEYVVDVPITVMSGGPAR